MGPERTAEDRLEVRSEPGGEIRITSYSRETSYFGGDESLLKPIAVADFLKVGRPQVLLWRYFGSPTGNYVNCEVVLLLERRGVYTVARRLSLGRCG